MRKMRRLAALLLALTVWAGCAARKPGEPIHPGFNVYSEQQDIEIGREAAAQARKELDIVNNRELQNYISQIGSRLASQPEAGGYPYSFTLVNENSINAFALPGGPIFVNTGLLAAADNEAQLAGVLAHEISHVALRHATSQASKASIVQIPAVLAGAAIGEGSVLAQLGQFGLGFGVNALMLNYSRSAESEADALGARLMAKADYDPIEMARFFEKLEREGGARAPQFLSSHPNPGNRIQAVQAEVQTLLPHHYTADTGQFPRMKQLVAQLPPSRRPAPAAVASAAPPNARSSGRLRTLETNVMTLGYPAEWSAFGDRRSAVVTLAPREGLVRNENGAISIGYGAVLSYYSPSKRSDLSGATQELVDQLASVNRALRVASRQQQVQVDGSPGLLTTLSGSSPYGGSETDLLLTVARPEGLFYMVLVVPSSHFDQAGTIFTEIVRSIRFRG
ncbi:MAG: M48 family metalloprotease [Acidobacteria bacterium]|nr:M48 family metalloprotease [Acidobacteriota bacterium]